MDVAEPLSWSAEVVQNVMELSSTFCTLAGRNEQQLKTQVETRVETLDSLMITVSVFRKSTSEATQVSIPRGITVADLCVACAVNLPHDVVDHLAIRFNDKVLDPETTLAEIGLKDGDSLDYGNLDGPHSLIVAVTGRDGWEKKYTVSDSSTLRLIFERYCSETNVHPWVRHRSHLFRDAYVQIDLDIPIGTFQFGEYAPLRFGYVIGLEVGVMLQIVAVPKSLSSSSSIMFVSLRRPLRVVFDLYCAQNGIDGEEKSITHFAADGDWPGGYHLNLDTTVHSYRFLDGDVIRIYQSRDVSDDF